jgi:hypothetical protein
MAPWWRRTLCSLSSRIRSQYHASVAAGAPSFITSAPTTIVATQVLPSARPGGAETAFEPAQKPSVGSLNDWIHLEAIQALIHHASAVIAAIFLFGITGRLIAYLLPDGYAKKIVIIVDDIVLLAVFALAGWRLLVYMWLKPEESRTQRIYVTQTPT